VSALTWSRYPRHDFEMDSPPNNPQPMPCSPGKALMERDGVLIHHGDAVAPIDVVAVMRAERKARATQTGEPG